MHTTIFTGKGKKIGTVAAFFIAGLITVLATDASAREPGGFSGPGAAPGLVTVKEATSLRDDTRVSLKGSIIKSLGDEDYIFRDATGTIEVEIDDDIWQGRTVNPEDVILIEGEVDRDGRHVSIDVYSVTKQ